MTADVQRGTDWPTKAELVGTKPILPTWLAASEWWTAPVRGERLATLRIGVGVVVLLDMLLTYAPHWQTFFAPGGIGGRAVFGSRLEAPYAYFSLAWLWSADSAGWWMIALSVLAAIGMISGIAPRLSAMVAWSMSVTMLNENYYLHNGGDRLRTILLFALIFAPADAVWSRAASWRRRNSSERRPAYIHPWALRLLFVQLVLLYFMNGVYKLLGPEWFAGDTMYYVSHDAWWSRWSADWLPMHYLLLRLVTWSVLAWELSFPLAVLSTKWRAWTLAIGAAFHVGSGIMLNLGMFPLYALCFYLPELPWERWIDSWNRSAPADPTAVAAAARI